jgi:hypothetical protein
VWRAELEKKIDMANLFSFVTYFVLFSAKLGECSRASFLSGAISEELLEVTVEFKPKFMANIECCSGVTPYSKLDDTIYILFRS